MVATPNDVRPVHHWASSLGVSLNSLLTHITDIIVRTETKWRNGAKAEQRT